MAWWLSWLERRPVTAEVVGSNPIRVVYNRIMLYIWDLSSAGRASALQAEGHRFEPYRSHVTKEYGEIAQLARARGSYPRCRGFESPSRYEKSNLQQIYSLSPLATRETTHKRMGPTGLEPVTLCL